MRTLPARLVGFMSVFLVCAACGDGPPTPPTSPTPPISVPTPTPAPSPPAAGVVTGIVREFSDSGPIRPVPNLRLHVREASSHDGAVGGHDLPDVVTGEDGRYTVPDVGTSILFFQVAEPSEHRFLCEWFVTEGRFRDLPVVHRSWSGNRPPFGTVITGGSAYGTVSETVNGALRPIAGATVWFEEGKQDPQATTDSNGFYMICSAVGTDQTRTVTAQKDGYEPQTGTFFGGWEFKVDLVLARRK